MLVILELLLRKVIGQDVQHQAFPAVQVLLELPGILMLPRQDLLLLLKRALPGEGGKREDEQSARGRKDRVQLAAKTPITGLQDIQVSLSVATLKEN